MLRFVLAILLFGSSLPNPQYVRPSSDVPNTTLDRCDVEIVPPDVKTMTCSVTNHGKNHVLVYLVRVCNREEKNCEEVYLGGDFPADGRSHKGRVGIHATHERPDFIVARLVRESTVQEDE